MSNAPKNISRVTKLKENPFPLGSPEYQLCPTLAQDVPTGHWCTLMKDRLGFIVTDPMQHLSGFAELVFLEGS